MTLRPYQRAVIDQLYDWFLANQEGNPIVAACVGAGKSIMIAALCHEAARGFDVRARVLVVVPSKELAEQNLSKLVAVAPDLNIGILSASLGRKDYVQDKDVVLGTVGTLAKRADRLGLIDLILIDECHLVSRTDTGQYRELIRGCQRNNAAVRVIGWTGTPFRGNGVWLHDGEQRLFTDIAARVTLRDLLDQGYLAPLVIAPPKTQITGEGVGTSNGDYIVSQLAQRLDNPEITQRIAGELVDLGAERKKWMVFCVTVEHAQHMAAELQGRGIACAVVSAGTPKAERERLIVAFRAGHLRALVNVAVLTTGFDVPDVDLIALVRNTKSPVLYVQIAGRGMRTSPAKQDCLWLDFTDTTALLGPVDEIAGRSEPKKKEPGAAPFRLCDKCGANNKAGAAVCEKCGAAFPPPASMVNTVHSQAGVLSGVPRLEVMPVDGISYTVRESKKDKTPYLRVEFQCGFDTYNANLLLSHEGFARHKAIAEWRRLTAPASSPKDSHEAARLLNSGAVALRQIQGITVDMNSKWKNVVNYSIRQEAA